MNYLSFKKQLEENNIQCRSNSIANTAKDFIKANCKTMTAAELSIATNFSIRTIRRFLKKEHLECSSGTIKIEKIQGVILTPREFEILSLAAKGLSNEEISKRIYISLTTLKTHLQNIYDKLYLTGIKRQVIRVRAILWYLRNVRHLMVEMDF